MAAGLRRASTREGGPLEEFVAGFRGALAEQGYAPRSIDAQVGLVRHLSRWMTERGIAGSDLSGDVADRFVVDRRASCTSLRSERALRPVLDYLRGIGAVPAAVSVVPVDPAAMVAARFGWYLTTERGLAPATVRSYLSQVRPFLAVHVDGDGQVGVTARDVSTFVAGRAVGQRPRSVNVGVNALRALLRWLCVEGLLPGSVVEAIGPVAARGGVETRKALSPGEVADLFAGLPAQGATRLRDEAILALMGRLGLRAGEVAGMELDDIVWRTGLVVVHGKGGRCEPVPLPVDVGEVIVAYLKRGRYGPTRHRQVFLRVDAPYCPLTSQAVTDLTFRALRRAGIAGPGAAHRLRHTAACRVVAAGGGLVEVGQLLRHASPAATAVYAKSDLVAMAAVARPWPVGGPA